MVRNLPRRNSNPLGTTRIRVPESGAITTRPTRTTRPNARPSSVSRLTQKSGNSSSGPSKNKTWKRKADDAKSYSKKELSAIGKKAAKDAVKKAKAECNAVAKRKTEEDEMSVSSCSSESINSANVVEKLDKVDKELANFDFSEDGEVSC